MRLAGSVALVTGASSGIGRATAHLLLRAGCRVVASGRDPARLAPLATDGATVLPADLASDGAAQDLADRALQHTGRVDILVACAGRGWTGQLSQLPDRTASSLLAVNLQAPITLTRRLLPAMRRHRQGHLSFVSSIAGRLGVAGESVYAASKAGLDVFAESLRLELRGDGITVSVVVPGVVDTDFFTRQGRSYPRRFPRPVPPERVATALVAAIARDRAEVYVPPWLRLPVAVRGLLPATYRRLAGRFG